MKTLPAALLICLAAAPAIAEPVRYVRDWITVPLRESPAPDSAIVHRGLLSGNAVTVLETNAKAGYSRVRSADGAEGWLANRYLMEEPGVRAQLEKADAEIAGLRKQVEQLKNEQPADQRELETLRAANSQLSAELEKLKHAPGPAEQLRALRQRNAALSEQFQTLVKGLQQTQSARDMTQFRNGALAVLAGALLTLVVPRLWPKKKSEWA